MPRVPRPFRRPDRSGWWTKAGGRWTRLGDTKAEATAELHRMLAARGPRDPARRLTVAELLDLWLEDRRRRVKPRTFARYLEYAQSLADHCGRVPADRLRPLHISAWLDAHPIEPDRDSTLGHRGWGVNTRALAASIAKMAARWAAREGWLERDPLALMRVPRGDARPPAPPGAAEALPGGVRSEAFALVLRFLLETGCRPGEARTLTASTIDLHAGTCVVSGKTGPRPVVLTAELVELLRPLCAAHPTGPVFRNTRGRPWSEKALQQQFARCSARAGGGRVRPYHARGIFATRAVAAGADSAVVARLLGHSDATTVKTLVAHYLRPDTETLRAAAEKARRPPPNSGDDPPR